jgi:hypothetical protein
MTKKPQDSQLAYLPNFVIEDYIGKPKPGPKGKSESKFKTNSKWLRYAKFLVSKFFGFLVFHVWFGVIKLRVLVNRFVKETLYLREILTNPESRNLSWLDLQLNFKIWKEESKQTFFYLRVLLHKFAVGLIILGSVFSVKVASSVPKNTLNPEIQKSFLTQFFDNYSYKSNNLNAGRTFLTALSTKEKKLENEQRIKKHEVQPGETAQSIAESYGLLVETIVVNNNLEKDKPLPKTLYFPWQDSYLVFSKTEVSPRDLSDKYKVDEKQIYSQNEDIINYETGKFPKDQAIIIPTKSFANIQKLEELQKTKDLIQEKKDKVAEIYKAQASKANGTVKEGSDYTGTFSDQKKNSGFIQPTSGSISRCVQPGHLACDIANASMPPVYSVQDGVVEDVYAFSVYG